MDIFETANTIDLAEQEARNLALKNKTGLDMLKKSLEDSFNALWNNPNATPQEILNVFGTDAYKLFKTSRDTILFIKSIDPEYVYPVSPKQFTINSDGSVTIIE